jgi:hypothetical protein
MERSTTMSDSKLQEWKIYVQVLNSILQNICDSSPTCINPFMLGTWK